MNPNVIIPQSGRKYEYIVPRTFKLHDELNYAEKPQSFFTKALYKRRAFGLLVTSF